MNKEQELVLALKALLALIETNQLVRNPMADSRPDWMRRMVLFVQVLKRAHELVETDVKEPAVAAKVIPIQQHTDACWQPVLEPVGALLREVSGIKEHVSGGCVSTSDPIFEQQQELLQTLSEKFQDDLEPITDHGKRYCI